MTTMMERPAAAPGSAAPKKALIERLNLFTALGLGVASAVVVWYLAKTFLPQNTEESVIKTREDQVVLLAMIAWFIGFMIGIGAFIGPFRWVLGRDQTFLFRLLYAFTTVK